jgi:hypothetical protein
MHQDIWVSVQHREGAIEELTFGLIGAARRRLSQLGGVEFLQLHRHMGLDIYFS